MTTARLYHSTYLLRPPLPRTKDTQYRAIMFDARFQKIVWEPWIEKSPAWGYRLQWYCFQIGHVILELPFTFWGCANRSLTYCEFKHTVRVRRSAAATGDVGCWLVHLELAQHFCQSCFARNTNTWCATHTKKRCSAAGKKTCGAH